MKPSFKPGYMYKGVEKAVSAWFHPLRIVWWHNVSIWGVFLVIFTANISEYIQICWNTYNSQCSNRLDTQMPIRPTAWPNKNEENMLLLLFVSVLLTWFWWLFPSSEAKGVPYQRENFACWKFSIKLLEETNLGVAQALLTSIPFPASEGVGDRGRQKISFWLLYKLPLVAITESLTNTSIGLTPSYYSHFSLLCSCVKGIKGGDP